MSDLKCKTCGGELPEMYFCFGVYECPDCLEKEKESV